MWHLDFRSGKRRQLAANCQRQKASYCDKFIAAFCRLLPLGFESRFFPTISLGDGVYDFCQQMRARRARDIRIEPMCENFSINSFQGICPVCVVLRTLRMDKKRTKTYPQSLNDPRYAETKSMTWTTTRVEAEKSLATKTPTMFMLH